MLVLSRRVGQEIIIDGDIVIKVVRIGPDSVRIGIEAPTDVKVIRAELSKNSEQEPPDQFGDGL